MGRYLKENWGIIVAFIILYLLKNVLPKSFIQEVVIYSIYTLGCSFLIGRLGFVSFGQPMYMAVGAYGTAFYLYYYGTNPFIGLLIGILAGLIINMLVGFFFVRLNSSYFTLANLAFCVIGFFIFQKLLVTWTHGDNGIWYLSNIDSTPIFDLSTMDGFFMFSFLVVVIIWLLYRYLMDSSVFGATCLSAKINERKLRFIGYNSFKIKWLAFVIANTTTALAGALYAVYFGFVSPGMTDPGMAVEPVVISMLGGAGNLFGPLIGSFIFIGLKDVTSQFIAYWELLVGLMLIIVMISGEQGIMGLVNSLLERIKQKFFSSEGVVVNE